MAFLGGMALMMAAGAAVIPAASAADDVPWPEGAVYTTDLMAGQHTDVGDVSVKYVGPTISVRVVNEGDWCMTGLKVAAGPIDTYSNNGGNPVPGKFPLKHTYQPCATNSGWLDLTMPVNWDYTVAVHATVTDLASGVTHTIASAAGDTIFGPASTRAELPVVPKAAVVVPANPAWADVPGGSWISSEPPGNIPVTPEGFVPNSYRKVVETAQVDGGYLYAVTPLTANSDNAEEVFVNDVSVGSEGQLVEGPVTDDQKYKTLVDYPLPLVAGLNTIEIVFRNYGVPDLSPDYTPAQNPTALAYHASYKVAPTETAWADGTAWGGANWATFIELPKGTSVTVSSTDVDGTDVSLGAGTYLFLASGTWLNRNGADQVDASCTSESEGAWATSAAGYPDGLLELQIDSTDVAWGPCDSSHVYTATTAVGGGMLNLRIYDGQANVQDPAWIADNSGDLVVILYKIA